MHLKNLYDFFDKYCYIFKKYVQNTIYIIKIPKQRKAAIPIKRNKLLENSLAEMRKK